MYTNNRDAYRQAFFHAWEKYKKKLPLEPVESQLLEIILEHPEYHQLLENPKTFQQQEFTLEENPFMHMSLHVALREQIRMNRPQGINEIYHALCNKYENKMDVEHLMMTCLARALFSAQQSGKAPSEDEYLLELKRL